MYFINIFRFKIHFENLNNFSIEELEIDEDDRLLNKRMDIIKLCKSMI